MLTLLIQLLLTRMSVCLVFKLSVIQVFDLFLAGLTCISASAFELLKLILLCLLLVFELLDSLAGDGELFEHPVGFLQRSAQLDSPEFSHLVKLSWE